MFMAPTALNDTNTVNAAPNLASSPINHIIVFYLENRSFDNVYGSFPGANGLANAGSTATQVDKTGKAYDKLPPIINTNLKPPAVDNRFPADMPNQPFSTDKYVPNNDLTGDLVHRFYQEQIQIDGGKMDKYAAISDAGGLVMSYYDGSKLPMWQYAKQYTLADNFFHAAFGGSFLNHFWLVCACSPKYDNAPDSLKAQLDDKGNLVKDGAITPDGYAVNTIQTVQTPHSPAITNTALLLPVQDMPTIGDRLNDKGISWAWYSGGWNDAVAGKAAPLFQFHHQPFAYFKQFADGTDQRAQHLKDETDLVAGIKSGQLPAVTFYKPLGDYNEHPGYTSLIAGENHVTDLIKQIQASPLWKDTAIIVTYDENGGLWDHVAPPTTDKWGPGSRVPTIIISPFAKKGFVDHTSYDTTSILKFIENRYGLQSLTDRDAKVNDLSNAFDFTQTQGQGGADTTGAGASTGTTDGSVPTNAPATGLGGSSNSNDNNPLVWLLFPSIVALAVAGYGLNRKRSRSK
jgi:phospholipase C